MRETYSVLFRTFPRFFLDDCAMTIRYNPPVAIRRTRGRTMKRIGLTLAMMLFASTTWAKVSCEDLVAKIEKKLETKGVKNYTLDIIPADQATELRVVGTCDAGKKKIVYKRGAAKKDQ